jgi:hypothetical protein
MLIIYFNCVIIVIFSLFCFEKKIYFKPNSHAREMIQSGIVLKNFLTKNATFSC